VNEAVSLPFLVFDAIYSAFLFDQATIGDFSVAREFEQDLEFVKEFDLVCLSCFPIDYVTSKQNYRV
jgi:hypothetical protein